MAAAPRAQRSLVVQRQTDREQRVLRAQAEATAEALDALVEDLEDEAVGAARDELPGIVGPILERIHPHLEGAGDVLESVNTWAGRAETAGDLVEAYRAIRAFDRAMSRAGSGAGPDIRVAGDALVGLTDAAVTALDLLPDSLAVIKEPVASMLRVAGRLGRIGTNIFADYFDRLNRVSWEGRVGRGVHGAPLDVGRLDALARRLGPLFTSDIPDSEAATAAERRLTEDADAFLEQVRDQVEGSSFLGVELRAPGLDEASIPVALASISAIGPLYAAAASSIRTDILQVNQMQLLIGGARRAFDDTRHRDSMMVTLIVPGRTDAWKAGHLLNRGTIRGVCSPTDVGLPPY